MGFWHGLRRWLWAPMSVGAAALLANLAPEVLRGDWLAFYFLGAVLVSTFLGGVGPGLLCIPLSILVAYGYFLTPQWSFLHPNYLTAEVSFVLVSMLLVWFVDRLRRAKQELRLGENRFRAAQDLSPDAFLVLRGVRDKVGRIIDFEFSYANPGAERLLGRTRLRGKRLLAQMPDTRDNKDLFERCIAVTETGQGRELELLYAARWYRNTTAKLGDGIALSFSDITPRKHAEEQMAREHAKVIAIGRIFHEGITCETEEALGRFCLSVAEDLTQSRLGYIGEINPVSGRLRTIAVSTTGEHAALAAPPVDEGAAPSEEYEPRGIYSRVIREGKSLLLNNIPLHAGEDAAPPQLPSLISFLGVPLVQDERVIGMIGLGNRINGYTEEQLQAVEALAPPILEVLLHKRANVALRASEEMLRRAMAAGRVFGFDYDPLRDFVSRTESCMPILRLESPFETRCSGAKFFEHIHPDDRDEFRRIAFGRTPDEPHYKTAYRFLCPDGRTVWLEETATASFDAIGRMIRIYGVATDVTARVEAEAALVEERMKAIASARLSALGTMAGGIAHEINNPLAVIAGCSEQLLTLVPTDDPARGYIASTVDRIIRNTGRIERIIRGLRNLARGGENEDYRTALLEDVLDDTLELCQARFRNHGIELVVGPLPTEPVELRCRFTQLAQVFMNLLNNAHDAVEGQAVRWVRLEAKDDGETVELAVTDSGPCIPAEVRDHLFEPFFTTKAVGKGTGLGLSISKGIIDSHRGELFLDTSVPNTRFVIRLPKHQPSIVKEVAHGNC